MIVLKALRGKQGLRYLQDKRTFCCDAFHKARKAAKQISSTNLLPRELLSTEITSVRR